MSRMRGLELVVIGRTNAFELRYEGGKYIDPSGNEIEELLDLTCFSCGASYFSLDGDEQIEFCPNCGAFFRREFKTLADLLEWSRTQNWGFLNYSGDHVFAVQRGDNWELRFMQNETAMLAKGYTDFHRIA